MAAILAAILAVLILILFAVCGVSPLMVFVWLGAIVGGWMLVVLLFWVIVGIGWLLLQALPKLDAFIERVAK